MGNKVTARISRWGNSLGIRIPKDALDRAGLREGDTVKIASEPGTIVLVPQSAPTSLDELLDRITPENVHPLAFDSFDSAEGADAW